MPYAIRNTQYDAIIVGAGHNGLVCAAYLARAGQRVLVLERRDIVGGAAVTEEIYPRFKFAPCSQGAERLHPHVMRDLQLARSGLEIVHPNPTVFAPLPDGRHLTLWRETGKTAQEIGRCSKADAEKWALFSALVARLARFLEAVYSVTPPRATSGDPAELLRLLRLGGRLRWMGKRDMLELLRVLPMSAAEFLDEWFESEALKGTLGASGIKGIFQGPLASGTAYMLLHHQVGSAEGAFRPTGLVRGGIGSLAQTLAAGAKQHGAEIRTGAEVAQLNVKDGRAVGVTLAPGGEEILARRVISNTDPRSTFLGLVNPLHLDPQFLRAIRNIKFRGACARVNLALGELPDFTSLPGDGPHLRGLISISPSLEYLERAYDDAKYGEPSRQPYLEALIPSLTDPALAPPGKHVLSVFVQYAPYHLKDGSWDDTRRTALGQHVIETLAGYAPNLKRAILHCQVLTPLDLEQIYGLTEGNIHHGELTLDQLFFMRPVPGWAQYRTPVQGLYLCGAGAHPGGGVSGAPGHNAAREILKDVKRGRPPS